MPLDVAAPGGLTAAGFLAFLGTYALAAASPGPVVAAVAARALATGARRALPFVAGVVLGELAWFALTALGLVALARAHPGVLVALRYGGVLFLLYLAHHLWTAPAEAPVAAPRRRAEGWWLLLGGLALNLGNPGTALFFLTVLPAVLDLDRPTPLALAQAAGTIVLVLGAVLVAYAVAAERARRLVVSPRAERRLHRGAALLVLALAAALAARE